MAVSPSRRQFVSPAVSKWQSLSTEDSLLTFIQRVDKWQSLPVEDSLFPQQSANGSLFQQKTVCSLSHHRVDKCQSLPVEDSLFPQRSTNGSLFQQTTLCSLSFPRGQQMAVSFNRRQFARFLTTGSTNGSLSQ